MASFKKIIKPLRDYITVLLVSSTFVLSPISTTLAEDGYKEVYQFLKICSRFGGVLIGSSPILNEKCKPIFEDKYVKEQSSTIEEFNSDWVKLDGELELTRTLSYSSTGNRGGLLSPLESDIRDELYESIKPNWLGIRNVKKAGIIMYKDFEHIAPILYAQFSDCFRKMHQNARLTRELISKSNMIKNGAPRLSDYQMYLMDKSGIFYKDEEDCDTFEKAFNGAKEKIIADFKSKAKKSTPLLRRCKTTLDMLSSTKLFDKRRHPKICAEHYQYNLQRILPIALKVMKAVREDEVKNNATSAEQLIN